MPTLLDKETDAWRILLFGRNGSELLLFRGASGFRLPELHIPRWQRIAPNLITEAKRLWNLDVVSVFPLKINCADVIARGCKYHVMEMCGPEDLERVAPDFLLVSVLDQTSFADPRDFLAVQQGMRFDGATIAEECQGPFSEFGSFQKISAWVQAQLRPLGLRWDGSFCQLQASASFALIRFQTQGGGVWFKAVGEPNIREFPVTRELTARFPSYLPVSIANYAGWNAWLTKEAEGQELFHCTDIGPWLRAVESLADLQIAAIPRASEILASGANDLRSHCLLRMANSFFQIVERMMEQQTKVLPQPLHAHDIDSVKEHVISLLQQTDFMRIPDTLNHLDPNPGNIFVSQEKCTFLDWATAGIGNPFFTFEYLRQHFRRAFPSVENAEAELCNSYLGRWTSILPREAAEQALLITPLTALFAYAVSVSPWAVPNQWNQPGFPAFLRSLGRRMHHESEHLKSISATQSRPESECHGNDLASVLGTSKS